MASTSFGRVFSRRVVRQFGLAEGREQMTDWLEEIVSDEVMQQAYEWVCQRRRDDSANDDVWDLRWRWDEILIGRVERGFDFLGSVMKPAGLEMAPRAIEHCVERMSRLDEQGADLIRIGAYLKRWSSWAKSGLMLDGGKFVDRAMEAISQRLAELATPHWPLPHTLGPLALERISQGRKTTQTHQHHR